MQPPIIDPFLKKLEQAKKKYSLSIPEKKSVLYSFSGQPLFITGWSNGAVFQASGKAPYP